MDDPDAGGGGGGAWPDPPGAGDPVDPGGGPPGSAYACISPEIGNKAAYTAIGAPYTGNKDIFSDVVTPYGDGIVIGPSTVPTASMMYKPLAAGAVTFISVKFMIPAIGPVDDYGMLVAGTGNLTTGLLLSLIFVREAFFDAAQRPLLQVRRLTTDGFTGVNMGSIPVAGQWYVFKMTITGTSAAYSIRTADTDVLFASGAVPGTWGPIDMDVFGLWQDANVNTGTAHVAALRFCGFADPSIPGTEALTGIGMTTTAGDMNSPAGFRRLSGQAITTGTGSVSVFNANRTVALVGQAATASRGSMTLVPYPDLLSDTKEFIFSPVWESVYLTVLNNGTFTISETDLSAPAYAGNWLAPSAMDVTTIASQYRGTAMTNYGAGTLDYTDLAPTALFSVSTTATSSVQKIHHFSITVVPTLTNPRYGEVGYQGVLRFRLALKLP